MQHPNRKSSNTQLTTSESFFYWATILTISVWSGLGIFAFSDEVFFMRQAGLFSVFSALTVFILVSFGVSRFADLPLRRWIVSWSKWVVAPRKRFFPFVFVVAMLELSLLGLGLHDAGGLFYCEYQKDTFFDRLSAGWSKRHNREGPELIGRAHAMFPNRPEPYFVYQSARRSFAEQSDEKKVTTLKKYAKAFLDGYEMGGTIQWCPKFFCCSCRSKSYFRLMPRIAMVESDNHARATKHKPDEGDEDAYLLWLYHMSERQDIDSDEYDNLYKLMKEIADAEKWKNSPVYPGVADHVMQNEYIRAKQANSECPAETMLIYTEEIIQRYMTTGDRSPIIPPNKTQLYYILMKIHLDQKTSNINRGDIRMPFIPLKNDVKEFLEYCPTYKNKFTNLYQDDEVVNIVNKLNSLVKPLGNDDKVKIYLTKAETEDWFKLCPIKM